MNDYVNTRTIIGKLAVTTDGVNRRNMFVYNCIKQYNTQRLTEHRIKDTDIRGGKHPLYEYARLVVTMGGGYPKNTSPDSDHFQHLVDLHARVYTDLHDYFSTN